jgi:hypothetical protein
VTADSQDFSKEEYTRLDTTFLFFILTLRYVSQVSSSRLTLPLRRGPIHRVQLGLYHSPLPSLKSSFLQKQKHLLTILLSHFARILILDGRSSSLSNLDLRFSSPKNRSKKSSPVQDLHTYRGSIKIPKRRHYKRAALPKCPPPSHRHTNIPPRYQNVRRHRINRHQSLSARAS